MAQIQTPILPYHNSSRISIARPTTAVTSTSAQEKENQAQAAAEVASSCSSSSTTSTCSPLNAPPGYPKLAELMNLIPETSIFRRFGTLNSLNLLYLQAELTDIERKLRVAQVTDFNKGEGFKHLYGKNWYFLGASAQDGDEAQLELVELAREKLDRYSKYLSPFNAQLKRAYRTAQLKLFSLLHRRGPDPAGKSPLLQPARRVRHGLHPALPRLRRDG